MSTAAGAGLRATAAAGVCKSLWLSYAFAGPAGEAPARPPPGWGGRVPTAQLWPRSQPRARAAWDPRSPSPAASGQGAPPPSLPPRHGLQAARAAPLEMSPALPALQGRHPGMLPALRPSCSPLPCATRRPAGSAGAPAIRDTRAIVLDPRQRQLWGRSGLPSACGGAAGPDGWLRTEGELEGTGKSCSEGRRRCVVGGGGGWGRW